MSGRLLIKAAMRSADVGHLAEQLAQLEQAGIDAVHFDMMDGHFVPEICFGPLLIRGLRKSSRLSFEVHLLVTDPDACVGQYLDAGADCVLVHVETAHDPRLLLERIHGRGREGGLAIAPGTPATALAPYLDCCDCVNVMTVVPGKAGIFAEAGLRNLTEITEAIARQGTRQIVQADGAVSRETRDRLIGAGATALVVGYPVFSQADFGVAIAAFREESKIVSPAYQAEER